MINIKNFLLIGLLIPLLYLSSSLNISAQTGGTIPTPTPPSETQSTDIYLPIMGMSTALAHDEIFISAGEFLMGCDPNHNDGYECNEQHQLHAVYLDDYYIDTYEVTNIKFAEFLNLRGANDCGPYDRCADLNDTQFFVQNGRYVVDPGYEHYPANAITWYGAEAYCASINHRLPTEAEWEKAARGPDDTRTYPWGNESPSCDVVNYRACVGGTAEVGSFPLGASPYGVMDLSGNIMEWVNDRYDADYYSYTPYNNPQGPDSGHTHVQKGAAWHFNELSVRVTARKHYFPYKEHLRFGFRCARSPE